MIAPLQTGLFTLAVQPGHTSTFAIGNGSFDSIIAHDPKQKAQQGKVQCLVTGP